MSTEQPQRIGAYEVLARLDRSGADATFKVQDSDGRVRALKLYAPGENDDLRAFRREALAKAAALRHAALIRYEEVGEHDGRVFAVMEFLPGAAPLRHPMPLHATLRTMRHIADGLAYLHQHGCVHGCLNPRRALVSGAGDTAKLTEAGMSVETRPAAMDATAAIQVSRLSRYLAPELLRGAAPDARSDIYSFGVLFYEALTGKLPAGRFRLPSQESTEVPPVLDEVVLRCLRQDPAARYGSAGEVVAVIEAVRATLPAGLGDHLDTLKSSARGVLGGGGDAARGSRRWVPWLALGAVALAAAALLARGCMAS